MSYTALSCSGANILDQIEQREQRGHRAPAGVRPPCSCTKAVAVVRVRTWRAKLSPKSKPTVFSGAPLSRSLFQGHQSWPLFPPSPRPPPPLPGPFHSVSGKLAQQGSSGWAEARRPAFEGKPSGEQMPPLASTSPSQFPTSEEKLLAKHPSMACFT